MFNSIARNRHSSTKERQDASDSSNLETLHLTFTGKIAGWSARHRWWVVAASIMVIILAIGVLNTVETKLYDGDGGEGEAAIGAELLDKRFNNDAPPTEQLVFSNPSLDANDPAYLNTVNTLVSQLRTLPEVESVTSYFDVGDASMVSKDGHVVLARVVLNNEGKAKDKIEPILDVVRGAAAESSGFEISMAGDTSINKQVDDVADEDFGRIMIVTLVLGLVILLIAFRAVVAAAIPLVLAIGSIISATAIAALVSQFYPLADSYSEMILLMGMAVSIDYSLFIVSRFRSERKAGRSKLEAIAVASNTTGRAVFYAGVTVVLYLTGLVVQHH